MDTQNKISPPSGNEELPLERSLSSPPSDMEGPDQEVAHSLKERPLHSTSRASSQEEVFFASGPFYAHLDDLEDDEEEDELLKSVKNRGNMIPRSPFEDGNGRRSNTKCNVLFAEMPNSFQTVSPLSGTAHCTATSKSRSPNGTSTSTGGHTKLKLKNLLMFGSGGQSQKSHHNLDACDSNCCQHQQPSEVLSSQQDLPTKSKQHRKSHGPFSPKMNPFHRILSSSQELFSHKQKNANPTSNLGDSAVRVIKPTAIRPILLPLGLPRDDDLYETVMHPSDTMRPATSAEFYESMASRYQKQQPHSSQGNGSFESTTNGGSSTSGPSSAFHTVNSTSVYSAKYSQHNRSNSLVESFLYTTTTHNIPPPLPPLRSTRYGKSGSTSSGSPRPRSSDGRNASRIPSMDAQIGLAEQQGASLDSLDTIHQQLKKTPPKQRHPIDSNQEPIHMTLEEVRRIAFGGGNSSAVLENSTASSKTCDSSVSEPNSSKQTAGGSSKHSHKSKLKLAFENILHKTHCIGPNSPSTSTGASSSTFGGSSKNVYKVTSAGEDTPEQPPMLSFIPNGYRRINIEDQTPLWQSRAPPTQEEPADRNLLASPFIRRALPPLPRDSEEQNGSSMLQESVTSISASTSATSHGVPMNRNGNSVIDQLRSHGYRSILAGIGVKRTVPLSSLTAEERQRFLDYATSIERVKNCGWYWGPVCGEMAEKLLETEPCGSFIVRDSSDEHYIFSLTFKLNGIVRHVRIEHDQGNFSFGSLQKYRSNTIVDFIESAVEHSRSGQFLFFLHRQSNGNLIEPVLPVRVQLLNPISRFRQVQSLMHNCRFTILKHVRRDQIHQLPLPEPLHVYLDTPYYYSEELANLQETLAREKAESGGGKKEAEERRRKVFMRTDQRTLVAKMLIDRLEVGRQLGIALPNEVYGGLGPSTSSGPVSGAAAEEEETQQSAANAEQSRESTGVGGSPEQPPTNTVTNDDAELL